MTAREIPNQLFLIRSIPKKTETGFGSVEVNDEGDLFYKARGSVRYLRGRELYAAQQVQAQVDAIFKVRHVEGLSPEMTLEWNGATWDIKDVTPLDRDQWVELAGKKRGVA